MDSSSGDESFSSFRGFEDGELQLDRPTDGPDPEPVPSLAEPRRSRRIAGQDPTFAGANDWPLSDILEALFSNGVSAPLNASREDLLGLLAEVDPAARAAIKKKAPKRKKGAPGGDSNRARFLELSTGDSMPTASSSAAANRPESLFDAPADPVIAALAAIQSSLGDMNSRLQTLESRPAVSGPPPLPAASTPPVASAAPVPPVSLPPIVPMSSAPMRSLATAVPVPAGMPFYPPAAAVSPALRQQILAGKYDRKCLVC